MRGDEGVERRHIVEMVDILGKAQITLDHPDKWGKASYALDNERHECSPRSYRAQSFCLAGSVMAHIPPYIISGTLHEAAIKVFLDSAVCEATNGVWDSTFLYNDDDDTIYQDVVHVLRIAKARAQRILDTWDTTRSSVVVEED